MPVSTSHLVIGTTKSSVGSYLTGADGRALYMWVADSSGQSNCSGGCAKVWPPVLANSMPTLSGGATAADLGTTTRAGGVEQVTYKGRPLYYFVEDTAKGSTKGQGSNDFGAKWWLVAPSGSVITASATSTGSGSSSSSSSGVYSSR
jgi:predicted lipoprotein with Yx(FWY)xxD motif